jgi:hypothetical protein
MHCAEVGERLPELLNGSLAGEERSQLEVHLRGCEACRLELEDTRLAAGVFAAHLPSAALVALAWDRPPGVDPELARQHLELCPECAFELAQVRESRALETQTATVVPLRRPAPLRPWLGAAAAGIVAAFVGGLWWGDARQGQRLSEAVARQRETDQRLSAAEAEALRLRQAEAELRARAEHVGGPQVNVPILELLPGPAQARQIGGGTAELLIPPGAELAVLMLSVPDAGARPVAVEVRDAKGALLWKGEGLKPNPLGGYALGIPVALLPEGPVHIVLSAPGTQSFKQSFVFRVRRTP